MTNRPFAPQPPTYPASRYQPTQPPRSYRPDQLAASVPVWPQPNSLPPSKPGPAKRSRRGVVAAVLAAAVISAGIGAAVGVAGHNYAPIRALSGSSSSEQSPPAGSVEQAAAKVLPSVVQLEIRVGNDGELGSGIILTSDGLILTNNHVVATAAQRGARANGAAQSLVTLSDGRSAPFTVVGTDPVTDIAVVRAEGLSGLTPITVGSSANLHVGQQVVAIGSPLALQSTVTSGIISALNRPLFVNDPSSDQKAAYDAIQTDAAINPGNSGGALVDLNGQLIGVNSAGRGDGGSIGLNFAIPVDEAKRISGEIIATGHATHASLDVQLGDDARAGGAKIAEVASGGAAAASGLPVGAVVTKVDDQSIDSADTLVAVVVSKAPGAKVTLTYMDLSGDTKTVQVRLGTERAPRGSST
jgi:putative serine protease PepD